MPLTPCFYLEDVSTERLHYSFHFLMQRGDHHVDICLLVWFPHTETIFLLTQKKNNKKSIDYNQRLKKLFKIKMKDVVF